MLIGLTFQLIHMDYRYQNISNLECSSLLNSVGRHKLCSNTNRLYFSI
jgi:hypothetical protein